MTCHQLARRVAAWGITDVLRAVLSAPATMPPLPAGPGPV